MSVKGGRVRGVKKQAVKSSQGATVPPSEFPADILDIVCHRVLCGERLSNIHNDPKMPGQGIILKWLNTDEAFRERFLECQKIRALMDSEHMQDIADGKTKVEIEKVITNTEGEQETVTVEVPEDVQRSALRVKTMQWRASKLLPKVFGDKIQQEHSITGDLAKLIDSASNSGHNLPAGE